MHRRWCLLLTIQTAMLPAQRELEELGPLGAAAIPHYLRLIGTEGTPVDVATGAARALQRFRCQQADHVVPVLLATLEHGDPRVTDAAMRTLQIWGECALDDVRILWVSGNRRGRMLAGALLGSIGPVDTRHRSAALAERLLQCDVACARNQAINTLSFAGRASDLPHLTAMLGDSDYHVVQAAQAYLARLGPAATPALPELERVLLGPDRMTSWGAGDVVARCGEDGLPVLERALRSENFNTRWSAFAHLYLVGPAGKQFADLALDALRSGKLQWIEGAARAIAGWDWPPDDPLRPAVRAELERVGNQWPVPLATVAEGLAALGPTDPVEIPPFLERWSHNSDPGAVRAALAAMLALGGRERVEARIPEMLAHDDARFASAAMELLARMDPPSQRWNDTIIDFESRAGFDPRTVVLAAGHAAPTFDDHQVTRAVDSAIEGWQPYRSEVDTLFATLGSRALPAIAERFGETDLWRVHQSNIERALTTIAAGHPGEVLALIDRLPAEDIAARCVLLRSLRGAGPAGAALVPELSGYWSSGDARIGAAAGTAIAGIGDPAIPTFAAALTGSTSTQLRALVALREFGAAGATLIPDVVRLLDDRREPEFDVDQTQEVVITLAALGQRGVLALELQQETGEDASAGFASALLSGDEATQIAAARAVARLHVDTPEIVRALIRLVDDHRQTVRLWTALALRELAPPDPEACRAYGRMLGDSNQTVRLRGVEALDRLQDPPAAMLPLLVETLDDPDPEVRYAAAALLVRFGAETRPAQQAIAEACDGDERLRRILEPLRRPN